MKDMEKWSQYTIIQKIFQNSMHCTIKIHLKIQNIGAPHVLDG